MKLQRLIDWYSQLTPESIPQLAEIYHEQASFSDPFNEVRGHRAIGAIFEHMFKTTKGARFNIGTSHQYGNNAWVTWSFDCELAGNKLNFDGATHLVFGEDGRVLVHRDYWDSAQLFAQIPMLGRMVRFLTNRLRVNNI
jgi:ketosteroid isomerase-like protein